MQPLKLSSKVQFLVLNTTFSLLKACFTASSIVPYLDMVYVLLIKTCFNYYTPVKLKQSLLISQNSTNLIHGVSPQAQYSAYL